MSDIRISIEQLDEPSKSIGRTLIRFYEVMKSLEKDEPRGGLQATNIVMTISEIEKLFSSPDNTARTAEYDSIWLTELGIGFKERELILKRFARDSKEVTDEDIEKGMLKVLRYNNGRTYSVSPRLYFTKGAKWMRDKILNKTK